MFFQPFRITLEIKNAFTSLKNSPNLPEIKLFTFFANINPMFNKCRLMIIKFQIAFFDET